MTEPMFAMREAIAKNALEHENPPFEVRWDDDRKMWRLHSQMPHWAQCATLLALASDAEEGFGARDKSQLVKVFDDPERAPVFVREEGGRRWCLIGPDGAGVQTRTLFEMLTFHPIESALGWFLDSIGRPQR